MTFEDFKRALEEAGIEPNRKVPLGYEEYFKFIDGLPEEVQTFAMDCFTPDGEEIEPGYEESQDTYWFNPVSWEEVQRDWEAS